MTGVTEKLFMCQMFMRLFRPLGSGSRTESETGIGGQNVLNARAGGELGLLTSKLAIFYRNSVERGQFQEPLEIQNFHPPPSNFRRLDPPL